MRNNNDQEVKTRLKEALTADPESKLYAINVDVVHGEAQLTGVVDTMADRERLYKIASHVPGVTHVGNGLTISTDGPITDRGVEFEVSEELNADPRIDPTHIGAKSVDGKVFLVGHSDDPSEIQAAKEAASKARGVTEIISQVKPNQTNELDELFHSQVRNDERK